MNDYIALCAISYILGIGAIVFSFYIQHLEDLYRPEGYHLKATLKRITELSGEKRKLDFAFYLFGEPVKCSTFATLKESRPAQVGRDYLIVYNIESRQCTFNPCQKYRIAQAILIIGGFFTTAFAVMLTIIGFDLFL